MRLDTKLESTNKWTYIVGLTVILISEFMFRDLLLPSPAKDIHIRIALSVEWFIFLTLLFYWIPKVERNNIESIGFRKFRWRYLWLGVVVYLGVLIASIGSGFVLESIGLEPIRSLQSMINQYSPLTLVGLFLTGTVVEEVFYRGYLIERIKFLTGKYWLAGIVSWLVFTLVHIKFFGLGPTLDVSVLSAALVVIYLKEKSIWPCIVIHGINGLFAYLIFPLLVP
jgi:membrane protease YdiL (CAAX protease family)